MFKEFVLEIVLNDISTEIKNNTIRHDYEMQYAQLVTELTTLIIPETGVIPCITINEKIFGNTNGSGFRMTATKFYAWDSNADSSSITIYFADEYHDKLISYGYTEEEIKYLEKIREVLDE